MLKSLDGPNISVVAFAAALALPVLFVSDVPARDTVMPVVTQLMAKEAVSGVEAKESYLVDISWPVGAATGRHIHSGDEYATVIEGELQLNVDGQPSKTVKSGEAYHNSAGIVHETKNVSGKPARSISVLVIDKGKPLSEPVK